MPRPSRHAAHNKHARGLVAWLLALVSLLSVVPAAPSQVAPADEQGSAHQHYVRTLEAASTALREGATARARKLLDECPEALRGWEWDLLDGRFVPDPLVFDHRDKDDEASAMTVAFSPDGEHLAVAVSSGELRLWNLKLGFGERSIRFGDVWACTDVAFGPKRSWTPGGQWLAVAADRVELVEASTGEHLVTLDLDEAFGPVVSVDVSSDGRLLACAGIGFVELWDIAGLREFERIHHFDIEEPEGELRVRFEDNGSFIYAWPFTDDFGMHPLEYEVEHALRIWDVETGAQRVALSAERYPVRAAVATSLFDEFDEGFPMALGMQSHAVQLVDAIRESIQGLMTAHAAPVTAVAVTLKEDRLATGAEDGQVHIWDLTTDRGLGKPLRTYPGNDSLISWLAWDRRGERLAAASLDGTVRLFETGTPDRAASEPAPGTPLVLAGVRWGTLSADGETLLTMGFNGTHIRNARTLEVLHTLDDMGPFRGYGGPSAGYACLSGDGTRITRVVRDAGLAEDAGMEDPDAPVILDWNTEDGLLVDSQTRQAANIRALSWCPTRPLVVGGTSGGVLLVWNRSDDGSAHVYGADVESGAVTALAFDPAGHRLVSAHESGLARVWDAGSWELLATLDHGGDALRALSISADGSRLATGGDAGLLRFWDLADGREIGNGIPLKEKEPVTALSFGPRGTRLLAGFAESGPVIVDTRGRVVLVELPGPRRYRATHRLAWTTDGRVFVWADVLEDDSIAHVLQVWNASG